MIEIRYNEAQRRFKIVFPYDPAVVAGVKQLPAREYNAKDKVWFVPVASFSALEAFADMFRATLTPEARQAIEREKTLALELAEVSAGLVAARHAIATQSATGSAIPPRDRIETGTNGLRNYQSVAVDYLLKSAQAGRSGAGLFYEVGLGKTRIVVEFIDRFVVNGNAGGKNARRSPRVLYICPASLKYATKAEIQKWRKDYSVSVVNGTPADRDKQWKEPALITIVNYETFLRDKYPKSVNWDLIVCDEAHRLANTRAKSSKAIRELGANFRIAMTGTPVSNRPDDLFGIMEFIAPGTLGSYWNFQMRYCIKNYFGATVAYKNLEELATRTSSWYIRKTKLECLTELPQVMNTYVEIELSAKERKLYDQIRKQLVMELLPEDTSKISLASLGNSLVRLTRLKQVTGGMELVGENKESSKIDALKDTLEAIPDEDKVIIFTQFATLVPLIMDALVAKVSSIRVITGDVPVTRRQEIVEEFSDPKSTARILIGTEAISEGLNLQAANHTIHMDMPWSIQKMTQRQGRTHRMGQTKPVTNYYLIATNTVDEYVSKVLYKKQAMANTLLSDNTVLDSEDVEAILSQ